MSACENPKVKQPALKIPFWVESLAIACQNCEVGFHFEEGGCFAMSLALHEALSADFEIRIAVDEGVGHAVVLIDGIAIDHQGAKGRELSTRYCVLVEKTAVRDIAISRGNTGEEFDKDLEWARQIIQAAQALDMSPTNQILVLVHPGSACGSATSNIGRQSANAARDGLCLELRTWTGGLIVLDGELSDELPSYPSLQDAINAALQRANSAGQVSIRRMANDPDQVTEIKSIISDLGARKALFVVTGAWYQSSDGGGCVGSVLEALRDAGCEAKLSDYAVDIDAEEEVRAAAEYQKE